MNDQRSGSGAEVNDPPVRYTQASRDQLVIDVLHAGVGGIFREHARILAVQENEPFELEMNDETWLGKAGDWIATYHPDDGAADEQVWILTDRVLAAYYHPWAKPVLESIEVTPPAVLIRHAIDAVRETGDSRPNSVVITKLEEALLWLNHETVVGG